MEVMLQIILLSMTSFFLIWLIFFLWKKETLVIMSFFHFGCMSFDVKELYIRP